MEKNRELDRKLANNWKEYLAESKEMIKLVKWIWQDLINDEGKRRARIMFWLMIAASLTVTIQPWALSLVFDGLKNNKNQVITGLFLYWVFITLSQFLYKSQRQQREYLLGEAARQLNVYSTRKFFEKSLGMHINESNELSEANVKRGYERVTLIVNTILFEGLEVVCNLVLSFTALWFLDIVTALMATFMIAGHFCWSIFLNQKVMITCTPFDKKWRALNRYRFERWEKIEKVKTFAREKEELHKINCQYEEILIPDRDFWLWFINQISIRGILTYVVLTLMLVYGAYQAWHGEMTLGLLFPLFTWAHRITDNLWRIGDIEQNINFVAPSVFGLKEALDLPVGLSQAENPQHLPKNSACLVEFRDVSFTYPSQFSDQNGKKTSAQILNKVSFTIHPGDKVALIGGSGAGKTTIMRLLLRYFDPTNGSIFIDGIDLKELELSTWLDLVGYVAQQPQILDETIEENLFYGLSAEERKEVSDKKLWNILKLLQIDFGNRLTHGLKTMVGKSGIRLSGGEGQRLMIGTAILKNPRFLVIDEATSSLDATTEKLVQDGLEKLLGGNQSALIITHRLNTVRRICNKFVMLSRNGHGSEVVAATRSFEELAEISPEFVELAENQGIKL